MIQGFGISTYESLQKTNCVKINKREELSDHDIKGLVKQREEESA